MDTKNFAERLKEVKDMNQITTKLLEMLADGKFPDSAAFFIRCYGIASIAQSVAPVIGWVIVAMIAACFIWKINNSCLKFELDNTKSYYENERKYWLKKIAELQKQLQENSGHSSK